jgi:hypothetical protein
VQPVISQGKFWDLREILLDLDLVKEGWKM